MVTKQKHFLDSLKQIVSKTADNTCPTCEKPYEGEICPNCQPQTQQSDQINNQIATTAYLVDLVSNHKIKIQIPICKVGRDESNDIVVSGDQSISRNHLIIGIEKDQYYIEDSQSRHGTFLNGNQIKTRELINDGDVVKVGVSLFWFVIENEAAIGEETDTTSHSFGGPTTPPQPAHVNVRTDMQTAPSDPHTSTMNEIPVMPNEQSLLERLRMKTKSFDQSSLFAHRKWQSQSAATNHENPPSTSPSASEAQIIFPALDESASLDKHEDSNVPANLSTAPPQNETQPTATPQPQAEQPISFPATEIQNAPSMSVNLSELNKGSAIYDQMMAGDLAELSKKYNQLEQEINQSQKQLAQIANQLNTLRSAGAGLINGSGHGLIEACATILSQLGWQVKPNQQDQQELLLTDNGQLTIARIIWTTDAPERSHLGQLSISQTQHWCDDGQEPKGILIVSRLNQDINKIPNLTHEDYASELSTYAAKKNVCIMTSLQVLALSCAQILENAETKKLRETIISCDGWLKGFALKTPQ